MIPEPTGNRCGATVEVAFASQKKHISLHIVRTGVMEANAHLLDGLSMGKGCIRYGRPEQIDPKVICRLLADSGASTGPVC
jgi:hypothetical protein